MKSFSTSSNNISTSEQFHSITLTVASLVAESVKNLPAVQETRVQSLGWEDPLEKVIASHSSILAWKISWTEEPGGLQSMGSQRLGHDWETSLSPAKMADSKESACDAGYPGLSPGSGRSPGEGHGSPCQYSRLLNPMDRGGCQAVQSMGSQDSGTT